MSANCMLGLVSSSSGGAPTVQVIATVGTRRLIRPVLFSARPRGRAPPFSWPPIFTRLHLLLPLGSDRTVATDSLNTASISNARSGGFRTANRACVGQAGRVSSPWQTIARSLATMKTIILAVCLSVLTTALRAAEPQPLNTNAMLRGYCYAGSRPDEKAFGYGPSDNLPKKLTGKQIGSAGKISLLVVPSSAARFGNAYKGLRLLLVNRTKSEAAFNASDSRLRILQEALDAQGQWRPIEYLPGSWCGNSYHQVFLPAGHYWEFAAPKYGGTLKTKLRFVLQTKPPIYSPEFEGSVNTEQFTNKAGHVPTGIMDPYRE